MTLITRVCSKINEYILTKLLFGFSYVNMFILDSLILYIIFCTTTEQIPLILP